MSRIPVSQCQEFLDPFLSPWKNSQSFSSFSWNRILLFYPVCTVCTRDCGEIGRQAIRCSSQNLYSPQLLFDKAKQSLSIGQNWDTKPSTRTLSLNNSTLSLNSSTLSLNNSMLSFNSSTLSLNSSTLSLNSSTLSLNSSTLSLSSSPLSYDSSTLSLYSSPLSYDSFSAERGSLQTDIMLTEQSHNF